MLAHFYTLSAEEERGTLEAQDGRPALLHERLSQKKTNKSQSYTQSFPRYLFRGRDRQRRNTFSSKDKNTDKDRG